MGCAKDLGGGGAKSWGEGRDGNIPSFGTLKNTYCPRLMLDQPVPGPSLGGVFRGTSQVPRGDRCVCHRHPDGSSEEGVCVWQAHSGPRGGSRG